MSERTSGTRQAPGGEGFLDDTGPDEEEPRGIVVTGEDFGGSVTGRVAEIDELMTGDDYVESLRDGRRFAKARGDFDAFVEKCMGEYDLDGWTAASWAR
jgi:hypothetical protein